MPIPKIIHQTFKTKHLPFITRWHIARFRKKNPDYAYEFYDDARIENFILTAYGQEVLSLYTKINIGAAKADFFRYAVLLKLGGVYLDIDCHLKGNLNDLLKPEDIAVLSFEKNPVFYVQWAMFYEPGHPFLQKTMEMMLDNIRQNKYPHDVHKMTGPAVYTKAINECLKNTPEIPYRVFGIEYAPFLKDKYKLAKFFLYENKSNHWKKLQHTSSVLKPE
jgi:mannosyltransferase OCH1-like enzyme